MAREDRKRKQPNDDDADDGDRRGRRDKRPKEEKPAPPLPSEIKNKAKRSEVYAKLKSEKKAQKRRLGRERAQAAQRAAELGEEARMLPTLPSRNEFPDGFVFDWMFLGAGEAGAPDDREHQGA
jgi:ribosome production factor 1